MDTNNLRNMNPVELAAAIYTFNKVNMPMESMLAYDYLVALVGEELADEFLRNVRYALWTGNISRPGKIEVAPCGDL